MASSFMRDILGAAGSGVSLAVINQQQQQKAIDACVYNLLTEQEASIVLVSLTQTSKTLLSKYKNKKLFIIDGASQSALAQENIFYAGNEGNLTKIQIALEKALEKTKNAIIIIDSLNLLSVYNPAKEITKFIYLFANKTQLEDNSAILIASKDAMDQKTIESIKGFCDRVFDYSKLSSI